jgi:hypothetical protein
VPFFALLYIEQTQPYGVNMHGQQTMKYLNDKAVADAMLAKHSKDQVDPVFEKAVEEALAARAKNITE